MIDRLDRLVAPHAPPQRLAVLRIIVATFAITYLLVRSPVLVGLADNRPSTFEPVGVLAPMSGPMPNVLLFVLVIVAIGSSIGAVLGYRYRVAGPAFGLSVLVLLTYRSSWGQILWFDIVVVLHALIVGFSPAADALAIGRTDNSERRASYGWPVRLAALVTVMTYLISGVAKLRVGGIAWVTEDSLRNHIAFSAARLEVFGATSSPLAAWLVGRAWLAPPMAAGALLLELGAPLALFGGRVRTFFVVGLWTMHVLIAATMFVVFAYPLFGVAFAPLFALERLRRTPSPGQAGYTETATD